MDVDASSLEFLLHTSEEACDALDTLQLSSSEVL